MRRCSSGSRLFRLRISEYLNLATRKYAKAIQVEQRAAYAISEHFVFAEVRERAFLTSAALKQGEELVSS